MDCNSPGTTIRRIFQTRTLEWVAFPVPGDLPYSRGYSPPKDQTHFFCISWTDRQTLHLWATWWDLFPQPRIEPGPLLLSTTLQFMLIRWLLGKKPSEPARGTSHWLEGWNFQPKSELSFVQVKCEIQKRHWKGLWTIELEDRYCQRYDYINVGIISIGGNSWIKLS